MTSLEPPPLNPAQRDLLDLLGAPAEARPVFDAGLRHELRAELEEGLAPVAEELGPDDSLWVAKHTLTSVHGCEGRHLAEKAGDFAWSPALARGAVVHKAVELSVHWRGELIPLDLVDEAMARLANDDKSISDWLRTCTESDRAELRSVAGERVTSFLECFPPLSSRWVPVTEGRLRADLLGGKVVLQGRTDLTLGRADGTRAGKVVVDLKTGGFSPAHTDDLRFYALVDTLRIGTPPRLIASYYLDQARAQPEAVTEHVLRAAVARTIDGVRKLHELEGGRAPELRPGPPCRWCPVLASCATGREHLGDDADDERWDDADDEI
ncbi:PD-(D/E)XK nuclease family protein [Rhabdothermincola salaria]|uniref:PD-(D/E)XK nuclease family protein n=1 Tax=Rhabdothermincola salaria TaxID=2903142 RepID=UPI001E42C61B|nr:PD-(D/E)XK nuclease family protein [Rhabdothermincola salaria]